MHAIFVSDRCHYCSRQIPPEQLHRLMSGQNWCARCYEWHLHALDVLITGTEPKGCQECGLSMDALKNASPATEISVRMFIVPKDGIYQMLCRTCKEAYCPKRADLYRGTQFGADQKIA